MEPRNIEEVRREVEETKDRLGKPVDQKIKELVIGLRVWGIYTEGSCEGHTDRRMPFPWVDVPYEQAEEAAKLVAWQNRPVLMNGEPNDNFWVIKPGSALRIIPENLTGAPLERLQEQAREFGQFLQSMARRTE